jgi:poly(A) polymerase
LALVAAPEPTDAILRAAVRGLAPVLPLLIGLGSRFVDAGHEIALVGGPVRDAFLGRESPDLDLTTSASPEQTQAILARWGDAHWDVGRAFGTIGARKGTHIVEVTTYRADAYDRVSRKPVVAFGDNLLEDLLRRDFAVNAMAMRLPSLEFVDPYRGLDDLAARVLRTPGAPEVSFADDPLRMMRAARFVSQLGFTVVPEVVAAMTQLAPSLEIVSAERVREEFVKLIMGPSPRAGLALFVETGLASHVLPELPALKLEIDEHHRHKDVYEHSLTVLEQAIALEGPGDAPPACVPGPDLVLRLAALLHDIGKPATRRFEDDGGVSFHHHEMVGAKLAARRMKAMRFDKDTIKAVSRLVELHLRFHGYGSGEWTDSAVRRYITDAGPLLPRLHRLTRSDCTTRNVRKAQSLSRTYDDLESRIGRLLEQEQLDAVRPELDGNEIAEVLGIPPGPVLGRAYKHLLNVRLDQGPIGREAAAAALRAWWASQPESASTAGAAALSDRDPVAVPPTGETDQGHDTRAEG